MAQWVKQEPLRRIDNHGHATLAVTRRRAVQPERVGAVDLDTPHVAVVGEARVDTGGTADGYTRGGEGTLGDGMALAKGELDPVSLSSGDGVGCEGQSWADLDAVDDGRRARLGCSGCRRRGRV